MFTGIVEHRGSVLSVESANGGMRLVVDTGPLPQIELGGSIAVNGVCLTGVESGPGRIGLDVVRETLSRSTLGELQPGDPVNLERPMAADGRFDGHIVQGHVDGVGVIAAVEPEGQGKRIRLRVPDVLSRYVIEKGSITVDGVSLTVAAVEGDEVEVALIPHSLQVTTLGLRAVGEKVNLEVDLVAKYVEKLLKAGS
ncbi:MAG TPA: riboflavin synthase [Acidimicrobiia bacterium]|nr:riboflavin synthase [Acidimicrobiia bacterium]